MAGVNVKDGLVKLLKMDSITRGIVVKMENNKLVLDFHVIVAYGVSILAVADNLVSNVKYKVEEFTSKRPRQARVSPQASFHQRIPCRWSYAQRHGRE